MRLERPRSRAHPSGAGVACRVLTLADQRGPRVDQEKVTNLVVRISKPGCGENILKCQALRTNVFGKKIAYRLGMN